MNSIYEEFDFETDAYTMPDGYFVDDFNTALMNLFADSSTQSKITRIENNQTSVKEIIKELQNPPADLEKQYDMATSLYDAYKGLTDLAVNPTGSLQTFSEKKQSLIDDFLKYYGQLNDSLPEKSADDNKDDTTPSA